MKTTHELLGYSFQITHGNRPGTPENGGDPDPITLLSFSEQGTPNPHTVIVPLTEPGRAELVRLLSGGIMPANTLAGLPAPPKPNRAQRRPQDHKKA